MKGARLLIPAVVLLIGLTPAGGADVLVLDDGRHLTVDGWWIEGDRVVYEKYGGTIGIPRARIVEIRPGDDGSDEQPPPARAGRGYGPRLPSTPAAGAGEPIDIGLAGEVSSGGASLDELELRYRQHPEERDTLAPRLAAALTLRGNDAMRDSDTAAAIRDYEHAVGLHPGLLPARANLAVAYLAVGRNRDALSQADRILRQSPEDARALYLRGEALYRDERMEEAIQAWERAERIEPGEHTARRLAKARREQQVGGGYLTSAAAHFLLRYDGDHADGSLGDEILDFLEDRFREMVSRYNHLPESVIVVILYPRQEFHDVTQTGAYTGGIFDGKIRVPLGNARNLNDRLRRTLVHELTHSFVHGKTRGACPAWLHEGLAQLEEGKRATAGTRRALARDYRAGSPGWGRELDYASSLALTEYLVARRGFPAVLDLLDELGRGASEGRAMESAFGVDLDGLLREWGESLSRENLS